MAVDQPAHHVGLARRAECGAGFLGLLDGDQAVDDLAALHQQAMHLLIDAVDVLPQIAERWCFGMGRCGHDSVAASISCPGRVRITA